MQKYILLAAFITASASAEELAPPEEIRIVCTVTEVPGTNFYTEKEITTINMTCANRLELDIPQQVWVHDLPNFDYYVGRTVWLRKHGSELHFSDDQPITCHDVKKKRKHGYDRLPANICFGIQYD